MKLVTTVKSGYGMVKVMYNNEYEEYVCKLYKVVGFTFKHVKGADYFTNDKNDAIGTASHMLSVVEPK